MNEIIKLTNGQPVVDSLTIADGAQIEHASVMKLTRKYEDDFNSFGRVGFETRPFETNGGTQKREVALFNENQAMLLFTYLKNTEIARTFKIRLVKAFSDCRDELAKAKVSAPALPDYPTALRQLASSLEKTAALEHKIAEDAPKVAFAETVEAPTATCSFERRQRRSAIRPSTSSTGCARTRGSLRRTNPMPTESSKVFFARACRTSIILKKDRACPSRRT